MSSKTTTVNRVPRHTACEVNRKIREQTERNIAHYAAASPEAIDRRLAELDAEWDIERTLEANAATAALIGVGLGTIVNRKFFALPAVVAGFLLQHAVQGWCPPMPVFRRMGIRTQSEIEEERYALKALRGDFRNVGSDQQPSEPQEVGAVLEAVRR